MALVNMKEMLKKACKEFYAVGNFDIFNMEMLEGVMDAAEEANAPVILAFGGEFEQLAALEDFAAYAVSRAKRSNIQAALHLDHATEFSLMIRAIKAGFTSVMADASFKILEENIADVLKIAEICRELDISVEAELGHVGGLDFYGSYGEAYTEVEEARYFVEKTGVDALAVAIGTVHGVYKSEPKLNIERLKELKAALPMQPFVLHGGSGLSDEELVRCVQGGINKVNIFTDLTLAAMEKMKADAESDRNYLGKCNGVREAVKKIALDRIRILGCGQKSV